MNAHDLGGYSTEMAEKTTGGNLDGQMGVHPNCVFQVERDSRFTNIVSLRLLRERFPISISALDKTAHDASGGADQSTSVKHS